MENRFRNKILKLALPITAQQFMLALVSACDAFMLGGVNQNSLSAVSLASQITFVFNLILTALTIGENMFVAQYYGKRDFDGLQTSAGLVLRYVFIISILFLLAAFFIPETLMRLFTNDTILIDYGIKYLKLIGLSYIFSGVLQVLQGILKNCGYAGRCTMISAVVVCVNIALNVILIYGYFGFPRMEIAGAALATVIANGLGLAITIYILHSKKEFWIGVADIKKGEVSITRSFWYKDTSCEELLAVMDRTMNGENVYPDAPPAVMIGTAKSCEFTQAEINVLRLVVEGKSYKKIAEELFISPETVKWHIGNMLQKTNFDSKTKLAVAVTKKNLIINDF